MILPLYVTACIDALENAGFSTYAVGGCVRDSLLRLTPADYDLCTNATPEQIRQVFSGFQLVLSGEKHGTVGVIIDHRLVEITTFRLEGGYEDSRHPDWVQFVSSVEEDLSRRDFTVNAMAYSPRRGLADPFGGKHDLTKKVLRAVGDPHARFTEDALRILRGVRFAVRYSLCVDNATERAMFDLAPKMDSLARERVFDELCKLLPLVTAKDLLRFAPVITQVIPELAPAVGFDQRSPHHAFDLYTHIAYVVEAVPPALPLRLAALLHDVGKISTFYMDETGRGHFPGHAKVSAQIAEQVLIRLKAPTALRKQVVDLIARHMTPLEPDRKLLRRRLGKYGITGTMDLLELQRADFSSKGTKEQTDSFDAVASVIEQLCAEDACLSVADLAVNGNDLIRLGFAPGKFLGQCLVHLLECVQDERIPNEKSALLAQAQHFLKNR